MKQFQHQDETSRTARYQVHLWLRINLWKTTHTHTHTLFNVSNAFVYCFLLIRQSGFLLFISVMLLLYCDANHAILSLPVMFGCAKACMPQLMFYVLLWTLLCSHMTTLLIINHVVVIIIFGARKHKAFALKYYYHKASTGIGSLSTLVGLSSSK